jgi:hypothetical protein
MPQKSVQKRPQASLCKVAPISSSDQKSHPHIKPVGSIARRPRSERRFSLKARSGKDFTDRNATTTDAATVTAVSFPLLFNF